MTRNERIRLAMTDANVSQKRLAEVLGVRTATISENLNSAKEVDSIKFVMAVAQETGCGFNWLINEEGNRHETFANVLDQIKSQNDRIDYLEYKEQNLNTSLRMTMGRIEPMEKENIKLQTKIERLKEAIIKIGGQLPPMDDL
jgi:transcriptional regulator with XRE-family HTH domain